MILQLRENTLATIKKNLENAQARMKHQADKSRSDIIYEEGAWVLVKLQLYKQTTVANRAHNKLC